MPADAASTAQLLTFVPAVGLACWAGAALCRRIGQPAVIGELAAGIALGPSLLGRLAPGLHHRLFPAAAPSVLNALGELGLIAFMFVVGRELDLGTLRGRGRPAAAIGAASIAVPFAAGLALAPALLPSFAPSGVARSAFVLFVGVAMAITAFPVLARILVDHGMERTRVGVLALTCAAANDAVAWCLLAVATAVAAAGGGSLRSALTTVALAALFAAFVLAVVRPLWARLARRGTGIPDGPMPVLLFAAICVSGLITTEIGINAIFGAFVLGASAPRDSVRIERAVARLSGSLIPVLLPLYFAVTGLNVDIGRLDSARAWLWFGAILAVAAAGKFGGTLAAARLAGHRWRQAATLGTLMNCRGLTELIVLNTGRQLGILSPGLFTMFVLMALVTTAVTVPVLRLLASGESPRDARPARAPALPAAAASGSCECLHCVSSRGAKPTNPLTAPFDHV